MSVASAKLIVLPVYQTLQTIQHDIDIDLVIIDYNVSGGMVNEELSLLHLQLSSSTLLIFQLLGPKNEHNDLLLMTGNYLLLELLHSLGL